MGASVGDTDFEGRAEIASGLTELRITASELDLAHTPLRRREDDRRLPCDRVAIGMM